MYPQFTVHVNCGGDHEFLQVTSIIRFMYLRDFKLNLVIMHADIGHIRKRLAAFQDEYNMSFGVETLLNPVTYPDSSLLYTSCIQAHATW